MQMSDYVEADSGARLQYTLKLSQESTVVKICLVMQDHNLL